MGIVDEPVRNRSKLSREQAGLSVGQAARLLGIEREDVIRFEEIDSSFLSDAPIERMADVYGVNVPWLRGDVDRYDYKNVDAMNGAEKLTQCDRDTIAEFAASIRGTKPPKTLDQIRAERKDKP